MSAYASFDVTEERRRLVLQAETLEPLSERALARLEPLEGKRALDVACGAMGILGALSRRVGVGGSVVGTDLSTAMIDRARAFVADAGLPNVTVLDDDAYASALPPASFDVVHSRFLLAPIGRDDVLAGQLERLTAPDGWMLLEEPLGTSWRVMPCGEAHDGLVAVIRRAFELHMGGFDAGERLLPLARRRGWRDVGFGAEVLALPPGHPYLQAPVLMAASLRAALLLDTSPAELDALVDRARALYARPETHGVTFTLAQVWGRPPRR